jgi:hypothetical protein
MPPEANLPVYAPYQVNQVFGTQEDFYSPSSVSLIRKIMVDVVKCEGPISLRLACRRVAAHWGFQQASEKQRARVRRLLPKDGVRTHVSDAGTFLWPTGTDPETYSDFRVPDVDSEFLRDAEDLPVEEVANAVCFLLRQHISVPEKELVRETGRLFGFQRIGGRVEARMHIGIELLIQRGIARRDDTTIVLQRGR